MPLDPESQDSEANENLVRIGGELDIGNTEELLQLFTESLTAQPELVVDFAEVQTCDAAVLQLICSLWKTVVQRGQRFRIMALAPAIENAAAAIGLPIPEWTAVPQVAAEKVGAGAEGSGCDV